MRIVEAGLVQIDERGRDAQARAAATVAEVGWVRAVGLVVAAISLLRVVLTLVGVAALDALAPIAFLVLIVILSVRMLMGLSKRAPTSTAYS